MGHLKEKYTKEYFTGKDENGNSLNYGATMTYGEDGNLTLREHDSNILNQIDFRHKNVLSLGVGRGEELCFAIEKGAAECTGVDFAEAAIEIASGLCKKKKIKTPDLINEDALSFLSSYVQNKVSKKFDIVMMFDFIEHIPRSEMREILGLLKNILTKEAIIVINTPSYKFDNDVIKDGFDEKNLINCLDTSDTNEATKGMHCNKYTVISLQSFMQECGYVNITEMHFFALNSNLPTNFSNISYAERWNLLFEKKFPVIEKYVGDIIEFPYSDAPKLIWKKFTEGNLKGVSLYVNEEYADIAYKDGNIDIQMIDDMNSSNFPKDSIIFDIGACVGADGFVFAKMIGENGKVISFEPNEYNRNRYFLNLSHNLDLQGRIEVAPYALGDKGGVLRMNISANIDDGHSSTSRIQQAHSKIDDDMLPEGFFESKINVMTLDEFVKHNDIIPNVLKIDIEGAEHLMLAGAINTLKEYKPVIYLEIHSEYCALICYKLLNSLNYGISIINEEEDNRLMVKAVYDPGEKVITSEEFMLDSQRALNSSLGMLRTAESILQKSIKSNERIQIEKDNIQESYNKLQAENKQMQTERHQIQKDNIQESYNKLQAENKQMQTERHQIQSELQELKNTIAVRYANKIKKILKKIGAMHS